MRLSETDLMKLIPVFMKNDRAVQALVNGINPLIRAIAANIKKLRIWDQIDELSEAELDQLAWELDVDWYNYKADIATKRTIIKQSDLIHAKRGTKWAVEQLIKAYFGDGEVREWFEYGGEPYHFKVITSNPGVTQELAAQFKRAIDSSSNIRSWLDTILISLTGEMKLKYGLGYHEVTKEIHQLGRSVEL